jgi:hypothetical protein
MDFGGPLWTSVDPRPLILLNFWTSLDVGRRCPTSPQVLGSNPRGRTTTTTDVLQRLLGRWSRTD